MGLHQLKSTRCLIYSRRGDPNSDLFSVFSTYAANCRAPSGSFPSCDVTKGFCLTQPEIARVQVIEVASAKTTAYETASCPAVILIGIDATPDPGLIHSFLGEMMMYRQREGK